MKHEKGDEMTEREKLVEELRIACDKCIDDRGRFITSIPILLMIEERESTYRAAIGEAKEALEVIFYLSDHMVGLKPSERTENAPFQVLVDIMVESGKAKAKLEEISARRLG